MRPHAIAIGVGLILAVIATASWVQKRSLSSDLERAEASLADRENQIRAQKADLESASRQIDTSHATHAELEEELRGDIAELKRLNEESTLKLAENTKEAQHLKKDLKVAVDILQYQGSGPTIEELNVI